MKSRSGAERRPGRAPGGPRSEWLPDPPAPAPACRHNDLPWQLLTSFNNRLRDARANLTSLAHTHTNIPKLKAGLVGGQVRRQPLHLPVLGSTLLPQVLAVVRPSLVAAYLRPPWGHRSLEGSLIGPQAVGTALRTGGERDTHSCVCGGWAWGLRS